MLKPQNHDPRGTHQGSTVNADIVIKDGVRPTAFKPAPRS